MDKIFELDDKRGWLKARTRLNKAIIPDNDIDIQDRLRFQELKNTVIYESPKTYVDGVAYNDGSWVIYDTCKTKKGKVITNIRCRSKADLVRKLYGYMIFLRMAGITNRKMILYHTVVFFDRLTYVKGMFDYNEKNFKILLKVVDRVLSKDVDELTKDWTRGKSGKEKIGCWDDREFCMDTKGMSKSDVTKMQHKIMDKKHKLDDQIAKYWVPGKSIKEMLDVLHANGVIVSKRRYCLWLQERKAVQNGSQCSETTLDNQDTENGERLCKMVHNAPARGWC